MKFEITVEADSNQGMRDALWSMWQAFQKDATPLGGSCPPSMGDPYKYNVKPLPQSASVTVVCDRCKATVEGLRTMRFTGGFYEVQADLRTLDITSWSRYANPGEKIVCDACMHADPRYIAVYGTYATEATPTTATAADSTSGKTEGSACE
jgi:hypothetical protein